MASERTPPPFSVADTDSTTPPSPITPSSVICPSITINSQSEEISSDQHEIATPEQPALLNTGHPIFIENLGDFDFDFSNRQKYRGRLLTKRIRNLSGQASVPDMSTENRRASSDSEVSLMQRFSAILTSSTRPSSPRSISAQSISHEKPLPDDRILLQNRLNFHISRLDFYKKLVNEYNIPIRKAHDQMMHIIHHATETNDPEVGLRAAYHVDDLKAMRAGRDELKVVVNTHRHELARICEKRVKWNEDAGLGPKVPAIFGGLWTDEQWEELFAI